MAKLVRQEQLKSVSIILSVMSITGLGMMFLLMYQNWGVLPHRCSGLLGAFMTGCYALLLRLALKGDHTRRSTMRDPECLRRRFGGVCLMLGISWSFLLVALSRALHGGDHSLLSATIVALVSAPVIITPLSVALVFWFPLSLGGIAAISLASPVLDISGIALLVGYASLSLFCMIYLNKALIRRVVAETLQSEARETIDLLLRDFEDSACDWLWETDANGRLTHASKRFADVSRVSVAQLRGADMIDLIENRWRSTSPDPARRTSDGRSLTSFMACQMPFRDFEVALDIDGEDVWWALAGRPKFSSQNIFDGYRGVASDITLRKLATDRADFLARYDELTGLANRRLFRETLSSHLQQVPSGSLALMCLDLDGFKAVNDSHGHPVGDLLLKTVARRLEGLVRDTDFCARLGGDEFAVIVPKAAPELLDALARRVLTEISMPYVLDDLDLQIGVSIGIATNTADVRSSEAILRHADMALYQSKSDGKGRWRLYDSALSDKTDRRRLLQDELRTSIDNGDLRVEFQPIFDLASNQATTVEVLVRWTRSSGEVVAPSEFIPLAENTGLIESLGEWVLTNACQNMSFLPAHIKVAVNVSPLQLRNRRFFAVIAQTLAKTQLDPARLELELTETAFFDMSPETLDMLREIRALGVGITLDDFGVGQTSLGQLRQFPFTSLKIDQSFVQDMPGNSSSRAIVRGLTLMAHELGIQTTAEGIETAEQLELVRSSGCVNGQGFLLGGPKSIALTSELLSRRDCMGSVTRLVGAGDALTLL